MLNTQHFTVHVILLNQILVKKGEKKYDLRNQLYLDDNFDQPKLHVGVSSISFPKKFKTLPSDSHKYIYIYDLRFSYFN